MDNEKDLYNYLESLNSYLEDLDHESIIKLYLQVRWERDMAMAQLEEHGIPFCGVAKDVIKVVKCGECKRFFRVFKEDESGFCMYLDKWRTTDCYCENGERKEE